MRGEFQTVEAGVPNGTQHGIHDVCVRLRCRTGRAAACFHRERHRGVIGLNLDASGPTYLNPARSGDWSFLLELLGRDLVCVEALQRLVGGWRGLTAGARPGAGTQRDPEQNRLGDPLHGPRGERRGDRKAIGQRRDPIRYGRSADPVIVWRARPTLATQS